MRGPAADIVRLDGGVAGNFTLDTEGPVNGLRQSCSCPRNKGDRLAVQERGIDHGRPGEALWEGAGVQIVQGSISVRRTERGSNAEAGNRRVDRVARIRVVNSARSANHSLVVGLVRQTQAGTEALLPTILEVTADAARPASDEGQCAEPAAGARVRQTRLEAGDHVVHFRDGRIVIPSQAIGNRQFPRGVPLVLRENAVSDETRSPGGLDIRGGRAYGAE